MTGFNLGRMHDAVAAAVPDRECIVIADRRLTYRAVAERSRRLANHLHRAGLGCQVERQALAGHETGQDLLAVYLHHGPEFLEALLGAFKARVAPFNVNYRYGRDELRRLLADADAAGIVFHGAFAPLVDALRRELPRLRVLVQVDDGSGQPLLDGAIGYEDALARSSDAAPPVEPSPDDLHVIYTGGTTGMPKGVLWRQDDVFASAMGAAGFGPWGPAKNDDDVAARARGDAMFRSLVIAPLMHGGGQLQSFTAFGVGGTVVFPPITTTLDPAAVWRTVERERPHTTMVIGDAMARPLVEELERGHYDASSLVVISNGGATLSPALKARLLAALPSIGISDAVGSSEAGFQLSHISTKGAVSSGRFAPQPGATVLSDDRTRVVEPGSAEHGWLAQSGRVALGYLGDAGKTARTFPVIDGVRFAAPGDRARRLADGSIELLGREAVTINTGGEKVYAEEVEQALIDHPAVRDVIVVGRPSERWGQEVCAVVALAEGAAASPEDLSRHAATRIARYKLPKAYVFLPALVRSPSGKADYRWAGELARRRIDSPETIRGRVPSDRREVDRFQRDGIAEGRLLIQRCARCETLLQPPRPMCPRCHSLDMESVESSGRGTVYAWIIPRHAVPAGETHVITIVELEEGVRVVAGIRDADVAEVRNGMTVEARFEDDGAGARFLSFVPATRPVEPPAPLDRCYHASRPRRRRGVIRWRETAIAGIGQTEFSKDSGRSELSLAAEACLAAMRDAGLTPGDVDGMVTYTQDANTEIALMDTLGIPELTFQARGVGGGHAANPVIQIAASAVLSGAANAVLVWRAFNERSQVRFGQPRHPPRPDPRAERFLNTPAALYGLGYQRYLHEYGVTNEDLGRYGVVARKHAATNPNAWFYGRPITLEDHQASRWIVEPILRLLDCCQESDGGVALVVTSTDRAADGPNPAVRITAASQGYAMGHGGGMLGYFEGDLAGLADCRIMARELFRDADLTIDDIDAAMIYENFSPLVFLHLEALGACGPGEAKDFIAGGNIEIGGKLPVNTHGGLLGEAYIHGLNNVVEAVRQIRGTSPNQVPGARHVLVANGVGGLILSAP